MRTGRFSEEQISAVLKAAEAGQNERIEPTAPTTASS